MKSKKYLVCAIFIFMFQTSSAVDWAVTNRASYDIVDINTVVTLARLKTDVTSGGYKKDSILVSTFLPAQIELVYQIKDKNYYFVACQEIKERSTWSLNDFIKTAPMDYDSITFACRLVQNYGDFYRKTEQSFAMAAIDLSKIKALADNIKEFVENVDLCENQDSAGIKNIIKTAAQRALSFNVQDYIDIYSFYTLVLSQINKIRTGNSDYIKAIRKLRETINVGKKLIQAAVLSRVSGESASGACGLSIYWPKSGGTVPTSYKDSDFDKNVSWADFVAKYK